MLQNKYLAQSDIAKIEMIRINAPVEKIYPLIENLSFRDSKLIYWLFKLRGIPVPESLSLAGLEKIRFIKLDAIPNKEIIIGLIGQFWTPTGKLKKFNPNEFLGFRDPDFAKATWSFELDEESDSVTVLKTETRVLCLKDNTRRKFKFYWTIIQPFSSWIRREILKSVKRQAENAMAQPFHQV